MTLLFASVGVHCLLTWFEYPAQGRGSCWQGEQPLRMLQTKYSCLGEWERYQGELLNADGASPRWVPWEDSGTHDVVLCVEALCLLVSAIDLHIYYSTLKPGQLTLARGPKLRHMRGVLWSLLFADFCAHSLATRGRGNVFRYSRMLRPGGGARRAKYTQPTAPPRPPLPAPPPPIASPPTAPSRPGPVDAPAA